MLIIYPCLMPKRVDYPLWTSITLPWRYISLILNKTAQMGESFCLCFTVQTESLLRYWNFTISCHKPYCFSSFHHHLHKSLRFIFLMSFKPSPPFFLLLHILVHLTRWYFLFVWPPWQKKVLLVLSSALATVLGKKIQRYMTNGAVI